MMHSDHSQQNLFQNPQAQTWPPGAPNLQQLAQTLLQLAQNQQAAGYGLGTTAQGSIGQGAYGFGSPSGGGQFATGWGAPQRQLTQQDVSAILQQIAPVLPQIIAQAQQHPYQPMAAYGGAHGARTLSQQDVSEVVRQILPAIPQLLQAVQQQTNPWGPAPTGFGQVGGGFGLPGQGWQGQAAYAVGVQPNPFATRQLTPQDVSEIARQLSEVIQQAGGQQPAQMRF
jgi:hypothetical protein